MHILLSATRPSHCEHIGPKYGRKPSHLVRAADQSGKRGPSEQGCFSPARRRAVAQFGRLQPRPEQDGPGRGSGRRASQPVTQAAEAHGPVRCSACQGRTGGPVRGSAIQAANAGQPSRPTDQPGSQAAIAERTGRPAVQPAKAGRTGRSAVRPAKQGRVEGPVRCSASQSSS